MPPLLAETKTIDLFIRKVNDMISANNISLRVISSLQKATVMD